MLEHGKENFNKGGIQETLYAHTTFIGGANPKYERFDKYKTLKEQIDFPPSYLSRNDLIFVIEDNPNDKDEEIIDKILNRYSEDETENYEDAYITHELLKKYLYYAKHNFNPIMTKEAQEKAKAEGARLISEAKAEADSERKNAISDIKEQVATLSVQIAEKVLRQKLSTDKAQMDFIARLLDEVAVDNKKK